MNISQSHKCCTSSKNRNFTFSPVRRSAFSITPNNLEESSQNGIDIEKAPIIKDNVDIGVGAKIIGDIVVEENIIIGANAIVRKNFDEKDIIIAGVPAKKIRNI